MLLTARNAPFYLIEKGLLSPEFLVEHEVTVEALPSRNRNFRIRFGAEGGVFLKQASLMDPLSIETLRAEARAYRLLQGEPLSSAMKAKLPRLLNHDGERQILALELVPGRESLGEYHRREMRFPPAVAGFLGDALGALHQVSRPLLGSEDTRRNFPHRVPWVLNSGRPESIPLHTQAGGSMQLVAIVQRYPEIREQLEAVRSHWTAEVLIHGDMKWDNCLVARDDSGNLSEQLHLVDWEMADVGDPAWDVGGVFQAYVSYWAFCLPAKAGSTPAQMMRAAPFRLEAMQPAMRAFWNAYQVAAALNGGAEHFLRRSVSYAAARAIQTAYESLYVSPQLTPQAVLLLQVSSNMLARPQDAIHELFGI